MNKSKFLKEYASNMLEEYLEKLESERFKYIEALEIYKNNNYIYSALREPENLFQKFRQETDILHDKIQNILSIRHYNMHKNQVFDYNYNFIPDFMDNIKNRFNNFEDYLQEHLYRKLKRNIEIEKINRKKFSIKFNKILFFDDIRIFLNYIFDIENIFSKDINIAYTISHATSVNKTNLQFENIENLEMFLKAYENLKSVER